MMNYDLIFFNLDSQTWLRLDKEYSLLLTKVVIFGKLFQLYIELFEVYKRK